MNNYPGGVWPVMLTPFERDGSIDERGLRALIEWYIDSGVSGMFASCQSSEIFRLDGQERVRIASITVEQVAGRMPIVASGHTPDSLREQADGIEKMAATGVDAVILLTNRFARQDENDSVWADNLMKLLDMIDPSIRLGLYECPYPYKRLMTNELLKLCAGTGRFYFMKDTCCDAKTIASRVKALEGTNLRLYNANTTTLLETLRSGAHGYSGIMANFHPELYVWLTTNYMSQNAPRVQDALTLGSLIERQLYPVNAKYHLTNIEKLPIQTYSRVQDDALLTDTFREEVHMMDRFMTDVYGRYCV
ncbi:MAG: dihydrodipicolinate synthase family protein [Clostridia bacterium]|nr:dihydrodipicolinate synthase family protein [Clostridia bacterium]